MLGSCRVFEYSAPDHNRRLKPRRRHSCNVVTDVLTKEQRSYCMSRIRGRDTKPEVLLRRALWAMGFRYRLHPPLPGRPDFVLPRLKAAIFVDGCFWHFCPRHRTTPKTNTAFWNKKHQVNADRDAVVNKRLRSLGWRVIRIWEHEVKASPERAAARLARKLQGVGS